jgi:hypothetical protein
MPQLYVAAINEAPGVFFATSFPGHTKSIALTMLPSTSIISAGSQPSPPRVPRCSTPTAAPAQSDRSHQMTRFYNARDDTGIY